ncbi:hypothetical protein LCGC14_1821110 [marine sediment metagenome]|uniref:Uncharacterized protein n=1 Tax=marine sediment metagenome TaxID=412755 RepID=A0A0F9IYQ8_9ZZZZ
MIPEQAPRPRQTFTVGLSVPTDAMFASVLKCRQVCLGLALRKALTIQNVNRLIGIGNIKPWDYPTKKNKITLYP